MTADPRREQRRLRRIFQRAMVLALATPLAIPLACSSLEPLSAGGAGGASSVDGGGGASMDGGSDAAGPSCQIDKFIPDAADDCGTYVRLSCDVLPPITLRQDCFLQLNDCFALCPTLSFNCHALENSCLDGS